MCGPLIHSQSHVFSQRYAGYFLEVLVGWEAQKKKKKEASKKLFWLLLNVMMQF